MAILNAAIVGSDYITVHIDSKPYTIREDHPNYAKVREELKTAEHHVEGGGDVLIALVDIPKSIASFSGGAVQVTDSEILYNGKPVHNGLTRRILQMMKEGFNVEPMVRFLENLMSNPSYRAVTELYDFMDVCQLPITDDGHFLAYKKVKNDYTDIYSGQFDNSPGAVCEMPRNEVDEDKDQTCSSGLHFCSISYLPHFGTGGYDGTDRVMIVKINPADVVAIPSDYNNAKGRTARYEVVDEWMGWDEFVANNEDLFKTSVVTNYTPPAPEEPKKSREELTDEEKRGTRAWRNGLDKGYDCGEDDAVNSETYEPEAHLNLNQVNNPGLFTEAFYEGYAQGWLDGGGDESEVVESNSVESTVDTAGDRYVPRYDSDGLLTIDEAIKHFGLDDSTYKPRDALRKRLDRGTSCRRVYRDGVEMVEVLDGTNTASTKASEEDKHNSQAWINGITDGMNAATYDLRTGHTRPMVTVNVANDVYGEAFRLAYGRTTIDPTWNWFDGDR